MSMLAPAPSPAALGIAPPRSGRSVLVVATVGPQTPELKNVDWIRIDAAQGTLDAFADRRSHPSSPVMFDIPGPRTRRTGSLLTTSEFLVFAAAEGFEWVNLRGVNDPEEVLHARQFLPPSTRLSVTISSPAVLLRALPDLCEAADAVLLARAELRRALGPHTADDALRAAIHTAALHAAPPLLGSGILTSMTHAMQPDAREVEELSALVDDGVRGLVLMRETTHGRDPQGAVDVARLVAEHARQAGPALGGEQRPSARVGGQMSVIRNEARTRTRSVAP